MQFGSFLELRPTKEVITKRPKGTSLSRTHTQHAFGRPTGLLTPPLRSHTQGIFGAPLESLCDAQAPVPSFLEQAFLYLVRNVTLHKLLGSVGSFTYYVISVLQEEKALRTTGLFDWDVEASTVQFLRSALEGTTPIIIISL
jgi:hypothetical protein